MVRTAPLLALALVLSSSCDGRGDVPEHEPPTPTLRRLSQVQYGNAVHDVLGEAIVLPTSLEPDEAVSGLFSVGASLTTISPRGVEQYETAAYSIAAQVMDDPALREAAVPCEPAAVVDDVCARDAIETFGPALWRRPLAPDEADALVGLAGQAAGVLGDFHDGLEYALAAMLQSPAFLFRAELGEDDPEGGRRFTDWEMASRLSFFLWNTTPDDELLAAAAAGELTTDEGLEAQVDRLLDDPRAREGVRNFFSEMYGLHGLEALNKDPLVFVHMSAEVGPSAREETLLGLEWLVFEEDGDYRDIYTTQRTFVDRKLAAIYGIPAPEREGFGEAWLPDDGGRRGLLGQVSLLALNAHPASSSVTLRGKYVREVILCQELPPPPANLNTGIPEASADAPTMRERVAIHLEDPYCSSCHNSMDPIGLALENFDGLGSWRVDENGFPIDPSSELDGEEVADAWELGEVLGDHRSLNRCLTQTVMAYANGHAVELEEAEMLDWHTAGFEAKGHRVRWLLRDVALSPTFRKSGVVQ